MEETIGLDYQKEYYRLQDEHQKKVYELDEHFRNEIDRIKNNKDRIIEKQQKEIDFYKNIIKGILHF